MGLKRDMKKQNTIHVEARNWIKMGLKHVIVTWTGFGNLTRNWIKMGLKHYKHFSTQNLSFARNWIKMGLKLRIFLQPQVL